MYTSEVKKPHLKRYILWLVIITLALVVIPIIFLIYLFQTTAKYDPAAYPVMLSQSLLDAAASRQNVTPPPELSSDLLKPVVVDCWDLLKKLMDENNGKYTIVVDSIAGKYGTPSPFGGTDVIIRVEFLSGDQLKLSYYNSLLEGCQA